MVAASCRSTRSSASTSGTKILAGAVARDGSIGRTVEVPTPTSGQEALLAELDAVLGGLLGDGALDRRARR